MQKIMDLFNEAIDFMSVTNNIVQFIVFFAAVISVFYVFSNKYLYPVSIFKFTWVSKSVMFKSMILMSQRILGRYTDFLEILFKITRSV